MPFLNLLSNRFAAEPNEISVSQLEVGGQELSKEDPAFQYGGSVSGVNRDCVFRVEFGSPNW